MRKMEERHMREMATVREDHMREMATVREELEIMKQQIKKKEQLVEKKLTEHKVRCFCMQVLVVIYCLPLKLLGSMH